MLVDEFSVTVMLATAVFTDISSNEWTDYLCKCTIISSVGI